ncbi:hypothetical protein SAMN00768000_0218 [Sulfobacillus thermosulfidooxidans DSM 9293]|uniref:Uncharacterized protein n=1 Tax=Sulfobacillus thermosulfidooxidans (strain DSM 9293 / VKM B-1269 / AT-1) TaxID=929705 RepID=A0A1W1W7H7_SULTA|nr:hypothetical protein [Sulfobacillus thermosulfidooxidans]SMC02010.1 hypothetical protein SAMN00768000_0218 [Sulfobacillus thermosulfidooxidans DSM 9293]
MTITNYSLSRRSFTIPALWIALLYDMVASWHMTHQIVVTFGSLSIDELGVIAFAATLAIWYTQTHYPHIRSIRAPIWAILWISILFITLAMGYLSLSFWVLLSETVAAASDEPGERRTLKQWGTATVFWLAFMIVLWAIFPVHGSIHGLILVLWALGLAGSVCLWVV